MVKGHLGLWHVPEIHLGPLPAFQDVPIQSTSARISRPPCPPQVPPLLNSHIILYIPPIDDIVLMSI